MKVRMLQTIHPIFIPDGGGSTGHYFRDHVYDIVQEGGFIRLRMKDKKDGRMHSVPMANVACVEHAEAPPANDNAGPALSKTAALREAAIAASMGAAK